MRTNFTDLQLADPAMAASEDVIRKCVHCGFCTATCPTYVLLGDELDSPRGRIYLMKEMLETQAAPTAEVVKHIDRCLSCLSCMTTCPSGVNYMHLVDHARAYIEGRYPRPWGDRAIRALLAFVLPYPRRFRAALRMAQLAKPFGKLLRLSADLRPLVAMLQLAPAHVPARAISRTPAVPGARGRVVLLQGCAEPVLRPEIRAATVRVLARAGFEVVLAEGEGCCGALVHHMGREADSLAAARRNVDAWERAAKDGRLDAILVTASGCGTTVKDFGFMLRNDPDYAERAARASSLARDISEFLIAADLPSGKAERIKVGYHAACSLQHGQKVVEAPRRLLEQAGYRVTVPKEAHLCCGSAGVYNILQPEIAGRLGDRKASHLARLDADVIATGNIGCAVQIGQRLAIPVVHIIELIDWAHGGPRPAAIPPKLQEKIR
jgi:glycolate oxidase iron-sulfur subunit